MLSYLTGLVYDQLIALKQNIEIMGQYDMIIARAKYSKGIDGITPRLNDYGKIKILNGRHPLLQGTVVPLNIEMGENYRSLIITGPNAGGKTIVLKTVGLLTLATMTGLQIPATKGTEIAVFEKVFVDIGDDQSLENSLSTFSSHVKNLAQVIKGTNKRTLLLFDEIGSGTEPGEGAALAIAILETVYHRGAITLATTHYNEIKNFSSAHPDFENAAMRFDKETLEPLYQLLVGKSGESNALWISKKMGIEEMILEKARVYMETKTYNTQLIKDGYKAVPSEESVSMSEEITTKEAAVVYSVGDKVFLSMQKDFGIVYNLPENNGLIKIYYKNEIISVPLRQVRLELKASELYPEGYDMNSLFVSFKERKLEKDIQRGSKKALKKIRKYGIDELLK